MKRLLSLLLAMAFVLVFAGCEEKPIENEKAPSSEGSVTNENEQSSQSRENDPNTTITDESDTTLPSNNQDSQDTVQKPSTTQNDEFITKAKAKQIALSDAGVKESQIRDYEIELDREKGVYYYEVNFEAGGFEYEYDIDAKSGKIAKKHKEKED